MKERAASMMNPLQQMDLLARIDGTADQILIKKKRTTCFDGISETATRLSGHDAITIHMNVCMNT